ncbi:nucleoside deaminase [Paenibacillus mucilaginosus]|uniref:Cytosine/adenosine deaminase n=2 Tax=Paenibacillus mucilaginosus TaxID=61624 RepID=H6NEY9_9BACL|nr:nucleoside deaminase [Paenibacillus mucilaginosus]AEI40021.1 cytosine/adenosine deaminase [Paenibacillus mucilaginosus KNP414]AFC28680.1 cytosine/adenosine deaminase [Paenibacillus mucilaginosus 3016]MCG7216437.1 nucleoside deaminase [Paenibacillus mucilaginosus]WDM29269.1 nucleoside deaminase [Paenibacillus mucilaginosus]WFA17458.1 nucleoside deaminase [Paenibacillus mucilaginosus]
MTDREKHIPYLRRCVELSLLARESGNTPFGALLAGPDGTILLEQGNIEITGRNCTGHAERTLMEAASKRFSRQELWNCTLYTSAEPCAMCAGSIYWGNVGRVVYGISEKHLAELTGEDEQNPTLDLPCREVFSRGRKPIEVIGPFPEVEEETAAAHAGYWK